MVSIIEVTTKGQLRQFVDYPNILYKATPHEEMSHQRLNMI